MESRIYTNVQVNIDALDENKSNVIYCLTFPSGKKYIGLTFNTVTSRIIEHCRDAFSTTSRCYNNTKYKAIRKYKEFSVSVLYQGDNLNEKEMEYIKLHNTLETGYNSTAGGEGIAGCKHTEESKNKISESLKGRVVSEKTRLLTTGKNNSRAKTLYQFSLDGTFIREWGALREAARELSISSGHISAVCTGSRKTAGGFK